MNSISDTGRPDRYPRQPPRSDSSLGVFLRARQKLWPIVDRHWTASILAICVVALCIRLLAITLVPHAGSDLELYYLYGSRPLHGVNPYSILPAVGDSFDLPPAEVGLYTVLLHIWNNPAIIRLWFAAADIGVILLIGLLLERPRSWRFTMALFYAASPIIVGSWVVISEDKGPYLLLILLVVKGLESDRPTLAWAAAALVATLRQISAVFFLPLALHQVRTRPIWTLIPYAALFCAAGVLGLAPFWPESVRFMTERSGRLNVMPEHSSILIIFNALHLYSARLVRPLLLITNLAILGLQVRRKLSVVEAVVFSVTAFFLFLPDTPLNRLAFVTMLLLLLVPMNGPRWGWLLVLTTLAMAFETGANSSHAQAVLSRLSMSWMFPNGGPGFALATNLPVFLMGFYYISDRLRGALPGAVVNERC
jgi:hypothetical protein